MQDIYHCSKTHANQNIFDLTNNNENEENTTDDIESWWPKLIFIIVHLSYSEDCFQHCISTMRKYYANNPSELRDIDQFERNYLSSTCRNPIEEYTKDTFLYRLINRTLRQKNIQFIFLFGFFLRDLYQQLKCEHEKFLQKLSKESKFTIYRGQIMSKTEIEKLKTSTWTIVTNSFLSTTVDPDMSKIYLGTSMPDDELQSILFEIELNLAEKSSPYADISAISWFPSESETLLMPGSEFRITKDSIYYDVEKKIWFAKLELVSDTIEKIDNRMIEGFGERRKMRYYIELLRETLTDFCHATTPLIQSVFYQLFKLFPAEKWISGVKASCLANYNVEHDLNYKLAFENWNEALKCWLKFKHDNELNVDVAIGQTYYDIGMIYYAELENAFNARENFDLSISHYQIAIKNGLTGFEAIQIYGLLHEMYARKVLLGALITDNRNNEDEKKENQSMYEKYLELYLDTMLKYYAIDDERISTAITQLTNYYEELDMYDEELALSKKFLELYEKDDATKNSDKIVELLKRIIVIYSLYKNNHETAMMYQSLLEEYTSEENIEAADDFIIDYRQNEANEIHPVGVLRTMRRWSTTD